MMDDLISRKALLNDYFSKWDGHVTSLPTLINSQPSARKKGHWKGEHLKYPSGLINFIYRCSECGYEERHAYEDSKPSNFCPNCGAYMKGGE